MPTSQRGSIILLGLLSILSGCGGSEDGEGATPDRARYEPNVRTTWQWQLSGEVNTGYDVELYDVDLFDVPEATIAALQAEGRRVVCYFSAGSYEDWRDDAGSFAASVLGEPLDGWAGERWLDIRADSVRQIMADRLDVAEDKGCDGVEPDNVDGYSNHTGFPLTSADQLDYNRFLAGEAHARGLAIGLKNDLEQAGELEAVFDFAVNESCHAYDECDLLTPFIDAGKPVFNAEYGTEYVSDTAARESLCADARSRDMRTLVLPLMLDDSFRFSCD